MSLSIEKVARIQQEVKQLQAVSKVSVQKLAVLVGKTTAAKQAIQVAPLFHCHLQALINRVVPLVSSMHRGGETMVPPNGGVISGSQAGAGKVDARNATAQWGSVDDGLWQSIHKSLCGDSFMVNESLSHADMEVVHRAPDILDGTPYPRGVESGSG